MKLRTRLPVTAAALAAAVLFGGPGTASAAVQPAYWKAQCDAGKACLMNAQNPPVFWNVDHCGDNLLHSRFQWAQAHGNTFRVYYENGLWDRIDPWTQRPLDPGPWVVRVNVVC